MSTKAIKVWWVNTPGPGNFGDVITPIILDYYNIPYEYTSDFEVISTGSIAKKAKDSSVVLGSGIMNSTDRLNPDADWRFVRGPLTRENVLLGGGKCDEIYGDPALLLPLLCQESKKEYDIGLIPHYVDYACVKEKYPNHKVINLLSSNPLDVAKEITKCRSVISSSLHGIICAHAYGIPAAWIKFSNKLKGDDVKFKDHYQAMQLSLELSTIDEPIFTVCNFNTAQIEKEFERIADE